MAYLFSAFAVVWLGIFAYLYGLMRRSQALERQLADLEAQRPAARPMRGARA